MAVTTCVDLGILLLCIFLVSDGVTAAERFLWIVVSWDMFLPVFRYFLPSFAPALWWTGMLADLLVILGCTAFFTSLRPEAPKA